MADNIAVLNLGSQNISLGLFEVSKNQILLKKYSVKEILADPFNEAIRNTQVQALLQDMVDSEGLASLRVLYTVSGQSVFTRFVKLPSLGDDNIQQLVEFEAQQHIPFPVSEVAWDWELIDSTGVEKEVAIVAIKKDLINEFDELVSYSGLKTTNVESAPVALVNSFYHSYPEEADPVMIVDAGAKSTNLIFIQGKKIFIRSVNVSGASITSAISKEYQISFQEAETHKVQAGRIALNGRYLDQWDDATKGLATVISNSLSRLPSEITRTINFFRSQHGGSPPTKVYLAGAAASMPYYKEFIEEKLSLPVQYFNPFNHVEVGPEVNAEILASQAHQLGELVGLASKRAENHVIAIDLVPESIQERRDEAKRKPFYLTAAASLIVGSLAWAGTQYYNNHYSKNALTTISNESGGLEKYVTQLSKLGKQKKECDIASADLSGIVEGRFRSIQKLESLREFFSSEVIWLNSIEDIIDYDFKAPVEEGEFPGSVYVKNNFMNVEYGSSSITAEPQTTSRGKSKKQFVNVVKVTGYWRENPASQQAVFNILDKIKKAKDSPFTFAIGGKELDDNQVLQIQSAIPPGEFKADFTMVLPLKTPIEISN